MHHSLEGPARSLLNSFTVATTPPPRPTSDLSGVDHSHETNSQLLMKGSGGDEDPSTTGEATRSKSVGERKRDDGEEEPRPSLVAPQPAPAPPSSTDQSLDRSAMAAAAPSPGLVSSTWLSAWRPSVRYADTGSASTFNTSVSGAPLAWHPSRAETPTRPPAWRPHSLRPATEDGELRGPTAEIGGRTPKIRYRSSSSDPPRASVASLSSPSTSNSVGRRSLEQQREQTGATTALHMALDATRNSVSSWGTAKTSNDTAGESAEGTSALGGWLHRRERTAPALSPIAPIAAASAATVPAWTPSSILKPFDATLHAGRSSEGLGTSRPAPSLSLARTRPAAASGGPPSFTASRTVPVARSETASPPLSTAPLSLRHITAVHDQSRQQPPTQNGRREDLAGFTPRVSVTEVWATQQPQPARSAGATTPEGTNNAPYESGTSKADEASHGEPFDATTVAGELTAEQLALSHLTLHSLTEEYNQFVSEGTVGWVGLQLHLRHHTQSTQITALDLTCYRMQRTQWAWFALEILPQLQLLEMLRLVQMGLTDDEVTELVRGSCGICWHTSNPRASPAKRASPKTSPASRPNSAYRHSSTAAASSTATAIARPTPLQFLRVLDLSGNAITQRSCNHLGKMLLWMADSLEEVRLLGNPLRDYGMQTLAIYLSKLNVETLSEDPELFPGTLRHQLRSAQEQLRVAATSHRQTEGRERDDEEDPKRRKVANAVEELPIGPVLMDLRDCRASARGLSDILAAASRAHRLRAVVLSHNVAGVTALLPLPPAAYEEALEMAGTEVATATPAEERGQSRVHGLVPAPRRLRLAKTPLISSGALMRRQHAAFSDVRGFAASCALATLVFHSVPLSQTCSPVGCRELLLNIFFSCPQLDLMDLSDTFEWSLVPPAEQQRLVAEANRSDVIQQGLRGPEVQRGLQMYLEDQGEVEFVLDSATVAGQTLLGDVFGELTAHAAYNAVMRQRVVPAAFAHVRELDLSNTGLTDAGVRGLCVSVRRGRARTGMLANLRVLNLSDNLLTARGCMRVISSFLLEGAGEEDGENGPHKRRDRSSGAAVRQPITIAQLAALALQRNAGMERDGNDDEYLDGIGGYVTDGANTYLSEVCTAAETAVLRRAALRSAARSSAEAGTTPPLTVYFSAPPMNTLGNGGGRDSAATRRRSSSSHIGGSGAPSVYYAGCDERGDIFCTCPRSRFFVSKTEPDPSMLTAAGESGGLRPAFHTNAATLHLAGQPQRRPPPSTAVFPPPAVTAGNAGTGGVMAGADHTSPPLPSQPFAPPDAQRSLLSSLDVPRTPSNERPRSQLQGRPGAELLTASDLRLPPRPTIAADAASDDPNGLVHSAALYPSVSSLSDPLAPSLSFPPPSSVLSHSSDAVAAAAAHWTGTIQATRRQQPTPPQSPSAHQLDSQRPHQAQHGNRLFNVGSSLGSLFMEKTVPREGQRRAAEADGDDAVVAENMESGYMSLRSSGAVATTDRVDRAGALDRVERGDGEDESAKDCLNSSTACSSKRRAKARACRSFVLSYDHPVGHLLCRALSVLLRPPPDPLGKGARAALAEDILNALQRACARAAAYPDSDDDSSNGVSTRVSPKAAAVVVESVKYLPPDLATSENRGTDSPAAPHWMRFEVTTNERKARMAQRLEEVLNISWAAQRTCFAHLLQWLEAHVVAESGTEEGEKQAAAAAAAWDPVQMLERAALASPAVRAKLDTLYAGSAVAAVHAHHVDAGECCGRRAGGDDAPSVVSLPQLHPLLWKEMGLSAVNTKEVSSSHTSASQGQIATPASTPAAASHNAEAAADGELEASEEGMHTAVSASEGTPRRSKDESEGEEVVKGRAATPSSHLQPPTQQGVPRVDLYAGSSNATEQQGVEGNVIVPRRSAATAKTAADAGGNAAMRSSPPFALAATSGIVETLSDNAGDSILISSNLAPGPSQGQSPTASVPTNVPPAGNRASVSPRIEDFRSRDACTGSDNNEEDRRTTGAETPEQQTRGLGPQQKSVAPLSPSPSLQSPSGEVDEGRSDEQQQTNPLGLKSAPHPLPANEVEGEGSSMLTDQLLGPSSPTERLMSRKDTSVNAPAGESDVMMPRAEADYGAADASPAVASRPQMGSARHESSRAEPNMVVGGRNGNAPESGGGEGTRGGSPSLPGSRPPTQSAREASASSLPMTAPAEKAVAASKDNGDDGDEEDIAVSSPVRVRRSPSELEGRVKTFTLSYTHQEGTAVCRAWRLLHFAVGDAAAAATEAHSPTSSASATLSQEARDCLCDDFLALLQPPDEDRKHAVLSVTLHGDGGTATAMLQVQVQTNERRGTLANRLQNSNHSVRRGSGSGVRAGVEPLTVDQVDRFYFPRLTRLLRKHKFTADTVAQMETFLDARPAVWNRLIKSYGSMGSLLHYYHGSAAALEHELGVSSWREVMNSSLSPCATAAPAGALAFAPEAKLRTEISSPTVSNDRVMPVRDEEDNRRSNTAANYGDAKARKRGEEQAADSSEGAGAPRPAGPTSMEQASSQNLKVNPAAAAQIQGLPPQHPRRLPTPPKPITHTSSISFDEVSEEPTSEAGPIVVLRGMTPSAAARSPSTSHSRNPQYYPIGPHTGTGEPRLSDSYQRDRRIGDADSDPDALSPMTSASASPSMARPTGVSPPHTQHTLEGSHWSTVKDGNSIQAHSKEGEAGSGTGSRSPTLPSVQLPPRNLKGSTDAPEPPPRLHSDPMRTSQQGHRGPEPSIAPIASLPRQACGTSSTAASADRGKSEYERVLEGKYRRLMRVAYDGVARGSVPLEPQHQQKMVIGHGKWGSQKVVLSLEWEILFVLTFEKSRSLGRSSRRAQMIVHPVGIGFECMAGDEVSHQGGETSSLHSSMVNTITADGSGVYHPPGTSSSHASKGSRTKKEFSKSAASHLIITIQRPFSPGEVGLSPSEIEKTLMAKALLTVSSPSSLSKAARLLAGGGNGGDDASNTSRGSAGANQLAQDIVYQLCQRSLTLDIEMKNSKRVQEALRLLKNSIRRATQAVKKSMLNAQMASPSPPQ
ncbi:hypothetical protein ABL78_2277 [Leptomonas seymouri]|uniref:Leucine rich repeat protein n=1 Tax=Leptomonas seymouri TaxID=5684 RepID=A0A0N0P7B8_LEPSE|nr:hypothetical protein ABL78_2277 [Leptomonas seymouri]|eukprot:KPI88609.1 hypothetical protein ABL78_2277 [Leptomonas seymouri]